MNVWRIHLKSNSQDGVDQRQLCLDKGIVGVGWQIVYVNNPVSWDEYYETAKCDFKKSSWWAALNAIKNRMEVNDLIWTFFLYCQLTAVKML